MSAPRFRVAVLGATGIVGQKLVARLADHPWFEPVVLAASERSAGRPFKDVVRWVASASIPDRLAGTEVSTPEPVAGIDVAFSALDAEAAARIEPAWAASGVPVVSNASAHRMLPHVPLVVPEVNADHLDALPAGPGFIVTNPNCATVGLAMALKPLHDAFGVEAVEVTTMQAVSGAGYPGIPALDILGNAVPFIPGEEDKLERETAKLLGRCDRGVVVPAAIRVSAQAVRVPVVDGHLLSVSVRLREPASAAAAALAIERFGTDARLELPSSPPRPLVLLADDASPQPRLHAALGGGMTVSVGRLRRCPVNDLRFVALVHNTERGAAGAAVLNGELLASRGRLDRRCEPGAAEATTTVGASR